MFVLAGLLTDAEQRATCMSQPKHVSQTAYCGCRGCCSYDPMTPRRAAAVLWLTMPYLSSKRLQQLSNISRLSILYSADITYKQSGMTNVRVTVTSVNDQRKAGLGM